MNWQEYNAGLKRRGSLTLWIDESITGNWYHEGPVKRGGQSVIEADDFKVMAAQKIITDYISDDIYLYFNTQLPLRHKSHYLKRPN